MKLPHNSAISLLGIYLRDMKLTVSNRYAFYNVLAALFIIGKRRIQPRYLSPEEQIKKMWGLALCIAC